MKKSVLAVMTLGALLGAANARAQQALTAQDRAEIRFNSRKYVAADAAATPRAQQ
jgi:hypothetical protein